MSDKMIINTNEAIEKKTKSARSSDLTTRERVNFVLSSSVMDALRKKSTDEQVPMSRIIDAALTQYLNKDTVFHYEVKLDDGIPLYHTMEIMLYHSIEAPETKQFRDNLRTYFDNYIYSSCIFKKQKMKAFVGTKFMLYISDAHNETFGQFLDSISDSEHRESATILLDKKEVQF